MAIYKLPKMTSANFYNPGHRIETQLPKPLGHPASLKIPQRAAMLDCKEAPRTKAEIVFHTLMIIMISISYIPILCFVDFFRCSHCAVLCVNNLVPWHAVHECT